MGPTWLANCAIGESHGSHRNVGAAVTQIGKQTRSEVNDLDAGVEACPGAFNQAEPRAHPGALALIKLIQAHPDALPINSIRNGSQTEDSDGDHLSIIR